MGAKPCHRAISSEDKQHGQRSNDRRTGGAKVGKPVRRTNKSGLQPPQTQELKCGRRRGAHTATPDTKPYALTVATARLRKCFQEAKLW
jgi:hypothetical protein